MSREKQIEELTNELIFTARCGTHTEVAKYLYNKGYRKQSEPFSCGHEKGGEWISVEYRLPEETGKYLVATKSGVVYQTKYYSGGKWGQKDKGKNITHWMPLPEAPKGGVE